MKVVANLVVDFGGGEGDVVLEFDDILNVPFFSEADQLNYKIYGFLPDNPDEETISNFSPGSSVYFRMQFDETKLELKRLAVTHGQIEEVKVDLRKNSQVLLWVLKEDENSLDYKVNSILETKTYGPTEADVRLSGPKTVVLYPFYQKSKVEPYNVSGDLLPANTYIEYDSYFKIYKLITPSVTLEEGETYPLTIVAYMEPA